MMKSIITLQAQGKTSGAPHPATKRGTQVKRFKNGASSSYQLATFFCKSSSPRMNLTVSDSAKSSVKEICREGNETALNCISCN